VADLRRPGHHGLWPACGGGAALANPDRKVICFSGDGSLMMNIQEMATAAENQLDVKIILMNNEALGLVHQQQSLFYKQGVFAATYPV
jgi:acetolactate synthase-1/2/3 large subunit